MTDMEYFYLKSIVTDNCKDCDNCCLTVNNNGTRLTCKELYKNDPERAKELLQKESNKIVKDYSEKIVYLAHPLMSTIGQEANYIDENKIANSLESIGYKNLVRPLKILPYYFNEKEASRVWTHLLSICDSIILSPDWQLSTGCLAEKRLAELLGLKIFYLKRGKDKSALTVSLTGGLL